MKLVDYNTFIKMPSGTIYQTYRPMYFGGVCVKGESIGDIDWFYSELGEPDFQFGDKRDNDLCSPIEYFLLIEKGEEVIADYEIQSRDGLFEKDRQFLIYDNNDIDNFINKLKSLKNV